MAETKIAAAIGFAHSARMRKTFAADLNNEVVAEIDKCIKEGIGLDTEEAGRRVNSARLRMLSKHANLDRAAHDQQLVAELEDRRRGLQHQLRIVDEALRRIRAVPA